MNPDPTPAAHLPAPLPAPAALLQRTQAALGLLRDVVQESSAEYWYERGKMASAREEWGEASADLLKCLTINSKHWKTIIQLCYALIQQGNYEAAAAYFEQIHSEPQINWDEFIAELSLDKWNAFYVLDRTDYYAGAKGFLLPALIACIAKDYGWLEGCFINLWSLGASQNNDVGIYEEEAEKLPLFHWLEGMLRDSQGHYESAHISYRTCLRIKPNFLWAKFDEQFQRAYEYEYPY